MKAVDFSDRPHRVRHRGRAPQPAGPRPPAGQARAEGHQGGQGRRLVPGRRRHRRGRRPRRSTTASSSWPSRPPTSVAAAPVRYVDPEGRTSTPAVVALDIEVTPELQAEGLARDLVRMVQQARKDADLDVTDRIALSLSLPPSSRPWSGPPAAPRPTACSPPRSAYVDASRAQRRHPRRHRGHASPSPRPEPGTNEPSMLAAARQRRASKVRFRTAGGRRRGAPVLLELDGGAGGLEGLLGLVGVVLRSLLEDGRGGVVHQVLGLLETEVGEGAHLLDDVDLLLTGGDEDRRRTRPARRSAAAAPPPPAGPAAATATGAAAVTPNFSSKAFRSSESSRTDRLAMESRISSWVAMISSPVRCRPSSAGSVSVRCRQQGRRASARGLVGGASASASAGRPRPRLGRGGLVGSRGRGIGRSAGSAALVDEGLEAVGEVRAAGPRAGRRTAACGAASRPANLASSTSRGSTSARALTSSSVRIWSPSRPPLITRAGLVLAKSCSALATPTGSPCDEGDGRGAGEQVVDLQAQVPGGEAHQGVLVDLVLASRVAQRTAEIGSGRHVEPPVLGEHGSIGGSRAWLGPRRPRRPSPVSGSPWAPPLICVVVVRNAKWVSAAREHP